MQVANSSEPALDDLDEPLTDTLKLIMQHSSTWDIKDLCRLLQVSSSCRQALQQSRCKCDVTLGVQEQGYNLDLTLDLWQLNLKARTKLQGFAEWLPSHTGLIRSLTWLQPAQNESPEQQQECQLLQRQLACALQTCRLRAAAATAAATAGSTGDVSANIQPLPLQLTAAVFLSSWPEPQLLRELAAVGVQELELAAVDWEPTQLSPTYSPCFATLSSSLQRLLFLDNEYLCTMVHSAGFMSAVQQLSALTGLSLGVVAADAAHQLPPQLQGLTATVAAGSDGSTAVSLSHLTALRQLRCSCFTGHYVDAYHAAGMEVLLPPNLTCLETEGKVSRVTGATALQEASIEGLNDTDINLLVHLCSLPVLGSLSMSYSHFSTPAASEVAAAALGSATALTRLKLRSVGFADGTGLCRQLAKLPMLVDLNVLYCFSLEGRSNLLCLTALTSLTSLALGYVGPKPDFEFQQQPNIGSFQQQPDDVVAAAVACHLTGLRELRLLSDSISSLALLPVVDALTGLSSLWLGGEQFVVGADDLMLLSSLIGLQELAVRQLQCSEAEHQQFLAGVPHLERVVNGWLL